MAEIDRSKHIGFFLGPLLFLVLTIYIPETFISEKAGIVLAIMAWMICWWITEAAPVYITALLPLVLFPALGVMTMTEASIPFANTSIFYLWVVS